MAGEKNFENKIKAYIKELGGWYVKYWAGSRFTTEGIPDLICCVNGYFVAIEVKAQNGRPSKLQLHAIHDIRKSYGFAFVVYPSGWEQLKEFLWKLNQGYYSKNELPIIFK